MKELIKDYYNKRYSEYEKEQNSLSVERDNKILEYIEKTGITNLKILDFGCGAGFLSVKLSKFSDVTAIDLSDKAIELLQEKCPQIRAICGDVLKFDFEEGSFDIVISEEVIEHVNDQPEYLRRASKYLKKGGCLILTTPNKAIMDKYRPGWSNQPIENLLNENELRALLFPYFKIRELSTIIFGAGHTGWLRILNSVKLNKLLSYLKLSFITVFFKKMAETGLHFIVLAQKG